MKSYTYYIKAPLDELASLAKKLVYMQYPIDYNGGRTMRIETNDKNDGFVDQELTRLEKRCKMHGWIFDKELYES